MENFCNLYIDFEIFIKFFIYKDVFFFICDFEFFELIYKL